MAATSEEGRPEEQEPSLSSAVSEEIAQAGSRLAVAFGGKFGNLLVALIALVASSPMIVEGRAWNLALALFGTAALVAGLHAARPGRRSLAFGLALALVDLGVGRAAAEVGARWLLLLQLLLWLSTLVFVTAAILERVLGSSRVTVETLQAAVCVYLLLGLVWVFLYASIDLAWPGEFQFPRGPRFSWTDDQSRRHELMRLIYFSFSTLTTLGYGDIAPSGGFARMVACLEAVAGQLYLTVLIARLVGMHIGQSPPGPS